MGDDNNKTFGELGSEPGQSEGGRARGESEGESARARPDGASHAMKDIIKANGDVRRK